MEILIVDDDTATRECLTELFRRQGHQTAACGSVEAAQAMLPYVDAVICDGLNGRWLNVVIAAETLGRPAVLYTGDSDLADDARDAGVSVVLKPGSVEELIEALRQPVEAAR
jgi:CheY-like chemotaxis protein